MRNKFLLLFLLFTIASCSTKKEILYFQNPEKLENMDELLAFEPVFEVNDIITIQVSSMNLEAASPFQMFGGSQSSRSSSSSSGSSSSNSQRNMGYLVDVYGNIQFPVLGKISVVGKSRSELESVLTKEIREYVTDAVIAVRLVNFRVIVLGEAGSQTVVSVENERMSVPELIANVGGITYDGKRNNILIIREVNGKKSIGRVNLTDSDIFKNPFFYLKQNDIVYVEPTYKQVKTAGFITSYTGLISLATTIFGIIVLISR